MRQKMVLIAQCLLKMSTFHLTHNKTFDFITTCMIINHLYTGNP